MSLNDRDVSDVWNARSSDWQQTVHMDRKVQE